MRLTKKLLVTMLLSAIIVGLFDGTLLNAKEVTIATPKVTAKTTNDGTGVKITIGKTADADGYEVYTWGTPAISEYCESFKLVGEDGNVYMTNDFTQYIEKNGKAKRSITHNDLQPGTYYVKVRSWNDKKYGTKKYSEWSKEKKFVIKEAATNGYADKYDFSKVKKGDVIKFGSYEQDLNYTNGKEAIEWIVLKKTKKSVLLISKYALDILPYNTVVPQYPAASIKWETSTLRKWLNSGFISSAFNKTEQGMIKKTKVENFDNVEYETYAGNDTKDKVFVLSQLEMINSGYGFSEDYYERDVNRRTAFAWKKGSDGGDYPTSDGDESCFWWLRTPGYTSVQAALVSNYGLVHSSGYYINSIKYNGNNWNVGSNGLIGVRPALYISLKS